MADRMGLADKIEAMVDKSPGADAMATCLSREQWRLVIAALRANTDPSLSRHHELQNPAGGTIPSDQGNAGGAGPVTGDPPVGSAPQLCADPSLERVEAMREAPRCSHEQIERGWTHNTCKACGAVYTDGTWGIASRRWFGDLFQARFYREKGYLPDALPVPNEGAERC